MARSKKSKRVFKLPVSLPGLLTGVSVATLMACGIPRYEGPRGVHFYHDGRKKVIMDFESV